MANQSTPSKETKSKIIKRLLAEGVAHEQIAAEAGCPVSYIKLVLKRVDGKGTVGTSKKEQREKAKAELLDFVNKTQDLAALKGLAHELIDKTKDQALLVKIHEVNAL